MNDLSELSDNQLWNMHDAGIQRLAKVQEQLKSVEDHLNDIRAALRERHWERNPRVTRAVPFLVREDGE